MKKSLLIFTGRLLGVTSPIMFLIGANKFSPLIEITKCIRESMI